MADIERNPAPSYDQAEQADQPPRYQFVATTNIPGYLPMDDDPPEFDTAAEAWSWLADERERDEDGAEFTDDGETYERLQAAATLGATGTVYGTTPGYEGDHDLGLAYSVHQLDKQTGEFVS